MITNAIGRPEAVFARRGSNRVSSSYRGNRSSGHGREERDLNTRTQVLQASDDRESDAKRNDSGEGCTKTVNATKNTVTTAKGHIVLVDGMSFLFRAFYGLQARVDAQKLINSKGEDVGVLHAYAHAMLALLESKPSHFVVCFDSKGKTFRHEMFVDYKANRPPTPVALVELIPKVAELIEAMEISLVKVSGVEADDIIGTLAKRSVDDYGFKVSIASPDKDFCQLLNENVRMLRPGGAGGQFSAFTLKDFAQTHEDLIVPNQFVDYLALVGDSSDNVPGVEGVGPKTARKLLNKYPNLEALLKAANADYVEGGEDAFAIGIGTKKVRDVLKSDKGQKSAMLSRKLVEIRTKLSAPDVNVDLHSFQVKTPNDLGKKAIDVFEKYELTSALERWKKVHGLL